MNIMGKGGGEIGKGGRRWERAGRCGGGGAVILCAWAACLLLFFF